MSSKYGYFASEEYLAMEDTAHNRYTLFLTWQSFWQLEEQDVYGDMGIPVEDRYNHAAALEAKIQEFRMDVSNRPSWSLSHFDALMK